MTNATHVHASQTHSRAVVWIDHLTAKIFTMGLTGVTPSAAHAHLASTHLHHKANTIGSGHVADDPAFLMEIAKAVEACTDVLILGPGTEKTALMHYLQSTHPQIALRVGVKRSPERRRDHRRRAKAFSAGLGRSILNPLKPKPTVRLTSGADMVSSPCHVRFVPSSTDLPPSNCDFRFYPQHRTSPTRPATSEKCHELL